MQPLAYILLHLRVSMDAEASMMKPDLYPKTTIRFITPCCNTLVTAEYRGLNQFAAGEWQCPKCGATFLTTPKLEEDTHVSSGLSYRS